MAHCKFSIYNLSSGNQHFLSHDEKSKCCLMKVFKDEVDPISTQVLIGITENKNHAETLEEYALRMVMTSTFLERFFSEDHEISNIRQNLDFSTYDFTLKLKCIRVFMKYNTRLANYTNVKDIIITQLRELKCIRNNKLCHNREYLTESRCHELAQVVKALLGVLLEMINLTWDRSMNIHYKRKKMETYVDQIMVGAISSEDLSYICLQRVLNLVVEPALNTATKVICYDKKKGSYRKYILENCFRKKDYKDTYFPEEKRILESESGEIKPDVTLHAKLIIMCKDWHPSLKNNPEAKEELRIIIGNIRGVRNLISHSMLSMTTYECRREAQHLGNYLRELGNFLRKMKLYMYSDVPEIDVGQIYSDVNHLMP